VKQSPDIENYPAKQTWQSSERAARYRVSRTPTRYTRYHREDAIITDWLSELPRGAVVLDCPCGTGRLLPVFAQMGLGYVGADFSRAMIAEARQAVPEMKVHGFVNADAAKLPFRDSTVDSVVLWRFFHHLPNPRAREAILREAARVTRRQVLVSFYHAVSFTALRRAVQKSAFGRKEFGQAITHWRFRQEAERSGLRVVEFRSYHKYVSINWFVHLQKAG